MTPLKETAKLGMGLSRKVIFYRDDSSLQFVEATALILLPLEIS